MKKILLSILIIVLLQSCTNNKVDYLRDNRFDLNTPTFDFPQKDFKIVGFGAYHGSAKTEDVERDLLASLTKDGLIKYYLPETDFSIAHYFNTYLKTGDTLLLKDLVIHYGARVPQEKTIETYKKWKQLRALNKTLSPENKLEVVGIDLLVTYKYVSKYLLEVINLDAEHPSSLQDVVTMVKLDTTDFSPYYNSFSKKVLKTFVDDYENDKTHFAGMIQNEFVFNHLIENLKITFNSFDQSIREQRMYDNYIELKTRYNFEEKPQFLRMGFFHIEKDREGNNPSFFTRLIEHNIYNKNEIISIIGYLTKSEVVWDELYDDDGNYTGYTKEAGYGIGDYEKEYFRGIQHLKDAKISDKTLYRLNSTNSPYAIKEPDLIEVIMTEKPLNGEAVKNMSTLDFLDYAVLISNSKAATPIYEMK